MTEKEYDVEVECKCPICGETSFVKLNADQYRRYSRWLRKEGLIQDLLPELSADQRELLKTGICSACWESL